MRRLVGLLRAVNVGGTKLLMNDLRRIALNCGFAEPQTLLASGNLLFGSALPAAEAGRALEAAIHDAGIETDVMVRDGRELNAVLAANPFTETARDAPARLLVMFLRGDPGSDFESLRPARGLGERVAPGPGCLYLDYPGGVGVSKLSNALIERRLGVRGTARNWNTVTQLAALLSTSPVAP